MSDDRRAFLKATTLGVATATAVSAITTKRAVGANQKLRLALIGCGGRGSSVARDFAALPGVEFAYVCDPDSGRAADAVRKFSNQPKPLGDFRIALDDKSIDAVIVATPDHWHTPASILAAEAGKHVYVEKPCSHNVREGRLLVEAARRNKAHIQHGTQSRSHDIVLQAMRLLREGAIGEVLVAKAWNVQRRGEIGHAEPTAPPLGFDYDAWVGPAPMVPFQSNRHHYTWHWWYNFGTGDMGNDGVHELDIARWGLGVDTHPSRVAAIGGKFAFDDDQQFPDTQYACFDYPGNGAKGSRRQLVFEMRLWSRYGLEGIDNGNAFYGTDGWLLLSKRGVLKVFDERNQPKVISIERPVVTGHFQNFVDTIRGDDQLRAEIEVGHLSATLCHLGNIAARVGRGFEFDPASERVVSDDEASLLLGRQYREGHWAVPKHA
ncbi:MAG: Gfo/Idh/MocA family oxidoreductase [Planctomycetaceae bacterium]|nr:Gfo/Idh/MocA family oxidoreductase [Planctomycetales bacterium]MCB9925063.1 Gfo/Idh/MocA family oxidoreductase [Planctomycetaceae bacterium]